LIAKQTGYKREIKNIYFGLSRIDSLEGNYKLAYEHYQKYNTYRDSLGDENNSKSVVELKLLYDVEKRDAVAKTEQIKKDANTKRVRNLQYSAIAIVLLVAVFFYWISRQKQRANTKIEKAYSDLKSTQAQLIQSEKMASLGELTAGIAHEIQNPLNFVNNFSELNKELIGEMKSELLSGNKEEAIAIANDLEQNLEKINHHGKRADAIVKGMLQHSRATTGKKEPTDINALAEEYSRLAYHGLRAKDNSFNAILKTDFDTTIGKIDIVPQDIGRVVLNLITNAFYAVNEKSKKSPDPFEPTVFVSTKKQDDKIFITVKDNGKGIPQNIIDKIFQPFFTTKPTGQGTGLGLSLSYDIVKAHGGEIKVETEEGVGTKFIIELNS
jgi:signal transduction histidine kinase